jgi:hypothetical protein
MTTVCSSSCLFPIDENKHQQERGATMDESSYQRAYEVAFTVGFNINLPPEAYTEDDWRQIAARRVAAFEAGDVVQYGYQSGRLAQRYYKFGLPEL